MSNDENRDSTDPTEDRSVPTATTSGEPTRPALPPHPLVEFSLRGMADELEAGASAQAPILGEFIYWNQASIIYAPPNTGKTLIVFRLVYGAIEDGRIDPDKVFYIIPDDHSHGLATKTRVLQDVGAHVLAPGHGGLKTSWVLELMLKACENGTAVGTLIVLDTVKYFTDVMDKKQSSAFARVCRQYVLSGGTVVVLGHTRKNPKADGSQQYQGTTDLKEDFDAAYIAELLAAKPGVEEKVVRFRKEKKRAASPDQVIYAYSDQAGISYEAMLASVHPVDPSEWDQYRTPPEADVDYHVAMAINELIDDGFSDGKMALAKAAARVCGVSQRAALAVLDQYTGRTVGQHYWTYETGPRGVRQYVLIPKGPS